MTKTIRNLIAALLLIGASQGAVADLIRLSDEIMSFKCGGQNRSDSSHWSEITPSTLTVTRVSTASRLLGATDTVTFRGLKIAGPIEDKGTKILIYRAEDKQRYTLKERVFVLDKFDGTGVFSYNLDHPDPEYRQYTVLECSRLTNMMD